MSEYKRKFAAVAQWKSQPKKVWLPKEEWRKQQLANGFVKKARTRRDLDSIDEDEHGISYEALEKLGLGANDFEDINNGDYDTDEEDAPTKAKKKKEPSPEEKFIKERAAREMQQFLTDNVYDFSDFDFFKRSGETDPDIEDGKALEFFLMHATWKFDKENGTVLCFTGNLYESSLPVYCVVSGFMPNFYVELPKTWEKDDIDKWLDALNYMLRKVYPWSPRDRRQVDELSKLLLKWEEVTTDQLSSYAGNILTKRYKITASYPKAVAAARQILLTPAGWEWFYKYDKFRVFEADVPFTQRFFLDTNQEACRWYKVDPDKLESVPDKSRNRKSTCKYEFRFHYQDMKMVKGERYDTRLPNFKIMSWDIEVCNKPFVFPVPCKDPVICITISAYRLLNPSDMRTVLLVYAKDGELPSVLPDTPYFYWFKSEPGVLSHFKKFIIDQDVDGFVGYNTSNFDWDEILKNGKLYFGKEYKVLGRDRYEGVFQNRNEWRGKTNYTVKIAGRFEVDMLKVVKNAMLPGKQFFDYSLGTVSQVVLEKTKVEFDINLTEQKFLDKEQRGEIWIYGERDAILPGELADKLNTIPTFVSVAQMTNIDFQRALDSGAGAKIDGYLRKLCSDRPDAMILLECLLRQGSTDVNLINACAKAVEGACVIEPKVGFHKKCYVGKINLPKNATMAEIIATMKLLKEINKGYTFVLDFNSMYPSIIILLNLCLRTSLEQGMAEFLGLNPEDFFTLPMFTYDGQKIGCQWNPNGHKFVKKHVREGLLAEAERKLWAWRDSVKADMAKEKRKAGLYDQQLKVTMNTSTTAQERFNLVNTLKENKAGNNDKKLSPLTNLEILIEKEPVTQVERDVLIKKLQDLKTRALFAVLVLDGLQNAIKIIMNGIFGQTIFPLSKFYKKEIGDTILRFGRYMLNYVRLYVNTKYTWQNGYPFQMDVQYGDSVTGDTPILCQLPDQTLCYRTIENIGNSDWADYNKEKEECPPFVEGLKVWTESGFTKINRVIRHKTEKKLLRVLTHTGCVDVTEDHSLLTPKAEKVKPSELKVGNQLLHADLPTSTVVNCTLTEQQAFAWGLFYADGSCGSYKTSSGIKNTWAINKQNRELLTSAITGLTEDVAASGLSVTFKILDTMQSSHVYKLVAQGQVKPFVAKWRELFYYDKYKKVPDAILNAPRSIRQAFWNGYYSGDGDKDAHGYIRCDNKGKIGAAGLYWLARSLGYPVSINTRTDKGDIYRITCTRDNKRQRRDPTAIKKIQELDPRNDYVYDLETENHHFSAGVGQMIVHNTDSVMCKFIWMEQEFTWDEMQKIGKQIESDINDGLFKNFRPLKMELEKWYKRFLLIKKKNYIGLKIVSNPDDCIIETKGVKYKKRGTSPMCVNMGKELSKIAIEQDDLERALDMVRKLIIRLKRREITLSDLLYAHNFGRDVTGAIYQYMLKCKQSGHAPPAAAEKAITERYNKLSAEQQKEGSKGVATPSIVYAYRAICKDPTRWFERGMTIHYIFQEGTASAKRDLVCSLEEAITYDIPYNIKLYIDEVMRVSRKVLALMVGDMDAASTPNYDKCILYHPSVTAECERPHISFYESRFGIKTIKRKVMNNKQVPVPSEETDDEMCNIVIGKMIDKADFTKKNPASNSITSFFAYKFVQCMVCKKSIDRSPYVYAKDNIKSKICDNCLDTYELRMGDSMQLLIDTKAKMDKCWDDCRKCLRSDKLDPMDCANRSCYNYTIRIDSTRAYYTAFRRNLAMSCDELF